LLLLVEAFSIAHYGRITAASIGLARSHDVWHASHDHGQNDVHVPQYRRVGKASEVSLLHIHPVVYVQYPLISISEIE
jgi:hypothetical protein